MPGQQPPRGGRAPRDPRAPRGAQPARRPEARGTPLRAAVPAYIGSEFECAPAGHRFRLYFQGWTDEWEVDRKRKVEMIRTAAGKGAVPLDLLHELYARQRLLAEMAGDRVLVVKVKSTAPFVTGVGSEHPLENGFAFLDPYGTPYLPGSSIKGVVRRAAEELALFEPESEWDLLAVWWLFGFDGSSAFIGKDKSPSGDLRQVRDAWRDAYVRACSRLRVDDARDVLQAAADREIKERWSERPVEFLRSLSDDNASARALHLSGSLRFWDALVRPPKDTLRVDIMNPHHGEYYQDGEAPGDFRSPNPIFFLAVPPGSSLTFVVELAPVGKFPAELNTRWRALLEAAFRHACRWLGFGAKTAVGYGTMAITAASSAAGPRGTDTAGVTGNKHVEQPSSPELERFMHELQALPPARVAGEIGRFIDGLSGLPESDQPVAARAVVDKYGRKEAARKAKEQERWQRILELASR